MTIISIISLILNILTVGIYLFLIFGDDVPSGNLAGICLIILLSSAVFSTTLSISYLCN